MSAIDYKSILQGFRDVLKDDAAIEAWCQAEFTSSLTVFVGMDTANPPTRDDLPLAIVGTELSSIRGQEAGTYTHIIGVDFGILWEDATSQPAASDNATEFEGLYKLSELGELIWTALEGASNNVALSRADYDLDALELFPLLTGGMRITIDTPHLLGGHSIDF